MLILFLCLGTGFNVYNYCCDGCESVGSDVFTSTSCEQVHENHHCDEHEQCKHIPATAHAPEGSDIIDNDSDHCNMVRHTITQINTSTPKEISWDLAQMTFVHLAQIIFTPEVYSTTQTYHWKTPPPLSSGRDVLLSSSILII